MKASLESRSIMKIKKSKCFQSRLRWKNRIAVQIEIVKICISVILEMITDWFLLLLRSRMKTNSRNFILVPVIATARNWIVAIFTWIWNLRMFNLEDHLFYIIQIHNNLTTEIKRKMRNIIKNNNNIHILKFLYRHIRLWINWKM